MTKIKAKSHGMETYRTKNGHGYYTLEFFKSNELFQAKIIAMPRYGIRDDDLEITFRFQDEIGDHWIEFLEPETIDSLEKAKLASIAFCEWTQTYIETGTRFNATEKQKNHDTNETKQSNLDAV